LIEAMNAEEDRLLIIREKTFTSQANLQNTLMIGLVSVDIALIMGATFLMLRLQRLRRKADARNEQTLRASELTYRRLFEAAEDGILILDVDTGRINDVNPFLYNLLGFSRAEMIGKTVGELSPFKDIEENKIMLSRLQKDGYVRYEDLPMETRDGQHIAVEFVSNVYQAGDKNVIQCNVRDITQRKQAEMVAKQLAAIVESSDEAIIGKDLNGIINSWNAGAQKVFGYSAPEIIGSSIKKLIPAELQEEENLIRARIKNGEGVQRFETVRKKKDGQLIDVLVTASPIKDLAGQIVGISKMAHDITQRKTSEAALRVSEGRYRTLFDYAPDGIVIADPNSYYLDANPGICRMLGYTRDELIGLNGSDIVAPDEVPRIAQALDEIKTKPDYHREWQLRRKDGSIFAAEVIANAMPDGNLLAMIRDITERKRIEARFRRLFNSNVQGVAFWNVKGEFTDANDAFLRIVGYDRDEMKAGRISWSAMTPPEYAHLDQNSLKEISAKGFNTPYEKEFFRKDGSRVPVLLGAATFEDSPDEGVCFVLDITERKATEKALRENEQRLRDSEGQFRTIANSMSQLAWVAKANGFIYWYNQRWYEYTGTTPEKMEGWGWQSVHDPKVLQNVMEDWTVFIDAGEPFEMEFPLRGVDGTFRTFLTRVQPLKDSAGRVVEWFGTNTDVEVQKQAEEKIHQLNFELDQRVAERTVQLESANQELEAFSYSVSHDLRAPLRAINGFAGIALEDFGAQLPEECRRYLERIRAGGLRMGMLIDDLLTFSRLSRQTASLQPVNSARIVQEVLDELKPQREGRQLDIQVGKLPVCQGDPSLLKQVWVNLISNAVKYTRGREPGIIEIGCMEMVEGRESKVESQAALPSTLDARPSTVFFVRDNGAGFDMKYANKLFGVFQRLHREDEFEGTGVGLAIVQRIIHRHGGRVWAQAEVNHGATFYFTIGETKL
jgi:PAS domain S-box-containing protein